MATSFKSFFFKRIPYKIQADLKFRIFLDSTNTGKGFISAVVFEIKFLKKFLDWKILMVIVERIHEKQSFEWIDCLEIIENENILVTCRGLSMTAAAAKMEFFGTKGNG